MSNVFVIGAKGKINVEEAIKKLRRYCSPCQIFDADVVCGKEHIIMAYHHAKRAFEYGKNVAKSIEMEILLYAAARRQIDDAIKFAGAKDNGRYVFLFVGRNRKDAEDFIKMLGLKIDNGLIKPSIQKLKKFGITEKELKSVSKSMYADLVLEKMALLELTK